MLIYNIILIICFVLDNFFTYFNVHTYRVLYPKRDYKKLELNGLVSFIWEKFGLRTGWVIATAITFLFFLLIIFYFPFETKLIMVGMYFMIIYYHIANFLELQKRKDKRKGIKKIDKTNIRKIVFIILLILSVIDLCLTYAYLYTYHEWRPDVPYKSMESNPLLLILFNIFGLDIGIVFGAILIGFFIWIIAYKIKGYFGAITIGLLALALIFGITNNIIHLNMLHDLMIKYPMGVMG